MGEEKDDGKLGLEEGGGKVAPLLKGTRSDSMACIKTIV